MFEAKIIADSITEAGCRLTTMQLTHPRVIHAEFMTHRMFARCASSSRAIPYAKMRQALIDDPFVPLVWGINIKGMQSNEELQGQARTHAVEKWLAARDNAIKSADELADPEGPYNLHKQIVNRLLEPWMWITVCATGDAGAWSNYFTLRCHPAAEPHIHKAADMARDAYFASTPHMVAYGDWHLPYTNQATYELVSKLEGNWRDNMIKVSVGRAARTSYLSQEGTSDVVADIALHDRLVGSRPLHASPAEHVCQAVPGMERHGCYTGWRSYRHTLPHEYVTDYQKP